MVLVSLVFLFVYLFGAYAYGAATLFSVRQAHPVWGRFRLDESGVRKRMDKPSLALFVISTVWFVQHVLIEFRNLMGDPTANWLDLSTLDS